MSYPTRQSSGAGRTVLAVTLATVFLTVIGVSVGVVAGRQSAADTASPGITDSAGAGEGRTSGPSPSASTSPRASKAPSKAPTPPWPPVCPDPMVRAAGSQLTVVQYIETDLSEVWICKVTSSGKLWYQGHKKSTVTARYPTEALVEGQNSLLLDQVRENSGDEVGYTVENTNAQGQVTRYVVTVTQLTIVPPSGKEDPPQPVTRHWP